MTNLVNYLKSHRELIILILFFGFLFFQLLFSHTLLNINGNLYSSGSTWGDLPYHLTLINNFKEMGLIETLNNDPLYYGAKVSYPFVFDYLSALLMKIGLNLRWSIILPSFIGLLALIILIYFLTLKITKKRFASFLTPFLFTLNGSIFGLYYFWQDFLKSGQSLINFVNHLPLQYTHLSNYQIEFSNLIADFLLPQRTIILGLVFVCLALYFLWNYWEKKNKKDLLWAGVIVGLMPFIHTHLFLALIIFCVFLFFIQWIVDKKSPIKDWIYFAIPTFILSIGPVIWLFPFGNKSFFRFQFGWMANHSSILWFWFKNLGLYFLFIIFGLIIIYRSKNLKNKNLLTFYLAALGIFIVANLFIFQPWDFDNTKIFILWFLLSNIIAALFFSYLWKKNNFLIRITAIVLLILTILPGCLTVYRELTTKFVLFSPSDEQLKDFVKNNTTPNDLFLTIDKHNNPIAALAGRPIIMGYRGWLWSHGIDYEKRYQELLAIYGGLDKNFQLLNKYSPKFILVEKNLNSADWVINYQYFTQNFSAIYENEDYILYQVKN